MDGQWGITATTVSRAWGPGWTEVAGDTDGHFIFLRTSEVIRHYLNSKEEEGCSLGSQVASGLTKEKLSFKPQQQQAGSRPP